MAAHVKNLTQRTILASRLLRAIGWTRRPSAVILMYHSVTNGPDDDWSIPEIRVDSGVFARQIEIFARRFHVVTMDDVLAWLSGYRPLPKKAVVLTFDDGFADNYETAVPILNRYGIPATFFLTTGLIGNMEVPWYCRLRHAFQQTKLPRWDSKVTLCSRELSSLRARTEALSKAKEFCSQFSTTEQAKMVRLIENELDVASEIPSHRMMMTWEEVRQLHKTGHIIGSHSVSHPSLPHLLRDDAVSAELANSKREIEKQVLSPVVHFSYPHPAFPAGWSDKTLYWVQKTGYMTALTTRPGATRVGTNPLLLPRLGTDGPEHAVLWRIERALASAP